MPKRTLGNLAARPKAKTYLKEWRLYQRPRLTVEAAADRIGISHSTLSRMERGLSGQSPHIMTKAAEVYGCMVGELFSWPPPGLSNAKIAQRLEFIDEKISALMDAIRQRFPDLHGAVVEELFRAIARVQARQRSPIPPAILPPSKSGVRRGARKAPKKPPPKHP